MLGCMAYGDILPFLIFLLTHVTCILTIGSINYFPYDDIHVKMFTFREFCLSLDVSCLVGNCEALKTVEVPIPMDGGYSVSFRVMLFSILLD